MHAQRRSMLWLLACGALPIMTSAILAPALPALQQAFRGEQDVEVLVRLALTTPALAIAIGAGAMGFLLDRWGRRQVLAVSLTIFAVAGMQGLWAQDIYGLIIMRFIFGLGVAGIMTATATLLADTYRGPTLRRALALQAGLMGGWGILSQLLAGGLAEYNWRGPFLLYSIALPLLLASFFIKSPQPAAAHAVHADERAELSSRWVLGFLGLFSFVAMSLFSLVIVHGPFYFRHTVGIGPRGTSLLISSLTAASSLSSLSLALWRRHLRSSTVLVLGFGVMALGFLALAWVPVRWGLGAGMLMIGAGIGSIMPCISAWVVQTVKGEHRGRFLGGLTTLNYFGQFLSPLWGQLVLTQTHDAGLLSFCATLAFSLVACIALLRLLRLLPADVKPAVPSQTQVSSAEQPWRHSS